MGDAGNRICHLCSFIGSLRGGLCIITLESGEYFVLGDNRNNSEDSRYADIGMVKKRYIAGKIWFTCAPFEKLGFTKG